MVYTTPDNIDTTPDNITRIFLNQMRKITLGGIARDITRGITRDITENITSGARSIASGTGNITLQHAHNNSLQKRWLTWY